MSKSNIHTRTHTDRDVMVARNRVFINIRSKYKMLHDRSIVARYGAKCLDKNKAQQALQFLSDIEKEIVL